MDFNNMYNDYLSAVERRLIQITKPKEPLNLYEPVKYIISAGGKRIRPVLTMICTEIGGGNPFEALDCACAIEILHNFTLVHDDIMDNSPIRRGRDTVHILWGQEMAILSGDVMIGLAYKLLPDPKKHERAKEIFEAFTNGLITVCEGQALDMAFNNSTNITLSDYKVMIEKKTSSLLETAALVGAHFASAGNDDIDIVRNFARFLGLAFQMQDDLLDLISDQKTLGKAIGNDIVEGKKTFMMIKAKERILNSVTASDEEKILINSFFINNGLSEEYIPFVRELLYKYNIIDDTIEEIDKLYNKALKGVRELDNNKAAEMLHWLISNLIVRQH